MGGNAVWLSSMTFPQNCVNTKIDVLLDTASPGEPGQPCQLSFLGDGWRRRLALFDGAPEGNTAIAPII